ncbi:MAG: alkaline phosphatase family protein [Myxococcota bacterium]|nr:alkaline phosphatase family protein [Myxococcota bacterium]
MRRRARRAGALLLLWAAALACAESRGPAQTLVLPDPIPSNPSSLVLVSVSGLTADRYRGPSPAMPTLAALAVSGISADAVRGVAPASRYPAHATLASGRRPAGHGIVADRRIGDRGVGQGRYWDAKSLRAPTLWLRAAKAGLRVATLGWPSTVGAKVTENLPDGEPAGGASWLELLQRNTTPEMVARARTAGAGAPQAASPGPARDAVLVEVACSLFDSQAPHLVMMQLSQTSVPLAVKGADAPESRAAFASADQAVARLLSCLQQSGRLPRTAVAVVGDHGVIPVHTLVAPNAVLAEAGLLTRRSMGSELVGWAAIARANGGSAFVYAKSGEYALLARRALEEQAEQTGAYRVVAAQEMLALGADPDAWFGLEAEPGFHFFDSSRGPVLRPSVSRGAGGYLPERPEMDAGFVAWGPGLARGLRIPAMQQTDVAPTLAPLLGLSLGGVDGRVLVGVLRLPRVSALPREEGGP